MSKVKKIIFIPPNGEMFINDFSIQRIAKYLKNNKNIHTTLLQIKDHKATDSFEYIDSIIDVESQNDLLEQLKSLKYDIIFHRSWMLAYPFAAKLVKKFDNVIVNIKDWGFSSKKEYKIMFGDNATKDFKAIKFIFKNAKYVLSHYTEEQAKIWEKQYNTSREKFIFFPEYSNENNFNNKENINYKKIKLVYAGGLAPSSFPEEMFPTKGNFRALKNITAHNINISYVLTPGAYGATQLPKLRIMFQDILYEDKFNKNFNLKKGKILCASVLNDYHFAFFLFEYCTKSEYLNKYAVPSKLAFYLEAGIPIIINKKLKAVSKLVKEHKLGIVFSNNELKNLDEILKNITKKEYKQFVLNVKKFRNEFIYSLDKFKFLNLK